VLGVFAGSALWWLLLSNGVAFFRERIDGRWMRLVNQISGTMIFVFGLYAIVSAFRR
jgi:arginine exporter protein ArgO